MFLDVSAKDNRVSRMIPKCLRNVACITLLSLNTSGGFRPKNVFLCLVFLMWIKTYFPLKGLSIYPCYFVIQFKSRSIAIMDYKRQGLVLSK